LKKKRPDRGSADELRRCIGVIESNRKQREGREKRGATPIDNPAWTATCREGEKPIRGSEWKKLSESRRKKKRTGYNGKRLRATGRLQARQPFQEPHADRDLAKNGKAKQMPRRARPSNQGIGEREESERTDLPRQPI